MSVTTFKRPNIASSSSGMETLRRALAQVATVRPPAIVLPRKKVTIDFEGRSHAKLLDVGGWMYSRHPTTEVTCLAWHYAGAPLDEVHQWHPAFSTIGEEGREGLELLLERVSSGEWEVEAHNAFFEQSMWENVCVARMGWPAIPSHVWRCSAAKAASFALPRSLDELGIVLGLPASLLKDKVGHAIMLKTAKPLRVTRRNPEGGWHEVLEDLVAMFAYNRQDVRAEVACSDQLRDLRPLEQQIWLMDQRMNRRGTHCDLDAARSAIKLASEMIEAFCIELMEITGGQVQRPSQRERVKDWCYSRGFRLLNTQGDYLDTILALDTAQRTGMVPDQIAQFEKRSAGWRATENGGHYIYSDEDFPGHNTGDLIPSDVRRVIELCRAAGRTSISKFQAMVEHSDTDGRMRDLMMYHGASTGRWTGKWVQPHNFVRGNIKDMDGAWQDILRCANEPLRGFTAKEWLDFMWGDAMEVLSFATRGAITATPGKKLYVADYAAIEARVLFWIAGETEALEVFRTGGDIYCELASEIYRRPINKTDHPKERQLGKKGILGLGYQMGRDRFLNECMADGIEIDEATADRVVKTYRQKYRRVKDMWYKQEKAAIAAVLHKGREFKCGMIRWKVHGRFLHAKLPSGRLLSYYRPKVHDAVTPWGDPTHKLTYMGVDTFTKMWTRIDTYGGKLVENVVQAIARDLMAESMLACDQHPDYDLLLSIHDELIAESDCGDQHEFETMMATPPAWANGCPIAVEGWVGNRYRK